MPNTHCEPTGSLGTGEIPVSNVGVANTYINDPGVGLRRGIVVNLHGLGVLGSPTTFPIGGATSGGLGTFNTDVVADGWIFFYPAMHEDFVSGLTNSIAIFNDVNNDSGHGSRFLNDTLRWWDHLVAYLNTTYGKRKIVLTGFSLGAAKTLQIAANRPSTIIGCIAHCPGTIFENVDPAFLGTGSTSLAAPLWYSLNWAGYDIPTTLFTAVSPTYAVPTEIGYGTTDNAVGWAGTTVAVGSNGTAVSTFAGAGTLSVAASTNIVVGPLVQVTGLTGGTGSAIINFTGTGAGTLTGCTTLAGSGTLATGNPCVQSTTDALITASAGVGVTRNQVAESHTWSATDAATYLTWIQTNMDPLAPANAF